MSDMLTTGQPLAGKYMDGHKEITDYTGVVLTVDPVGNMLYVTILFHGGRTVDYITDMNGHSVDTGMTPLPCPLASDPVPMIPVH